MHRSQPVDSFTIAYHETGPADAASVVLLHGWPGDSHDYRAVVPLLANRYRVIVPDLRGFGASDRHLVDPDAALRDQHLLRDAPDRRFAPGSVWIWLSRPEWVGVATRIQAECSAALPASCPAPRG